MLKDLNHKEVEGVSFAIAKTPDETGETTFYLYIINENQYALDNVLIMTEAHENQDGSGRKTSKLRHFFERVDASSHQKVETVDPSVFSFHNRVWISFYVDGTMRDKRFIIAPFKEYELEEISVLNLKGKLAE